MSERTRFEYDVFISYSSKDKEIVHPIAKRLKDDGLRVWLDAWQIQPGDNIPHKIEEGLEHSHVLVFSMSANAFGSDWAKLESQTFRFRDPLNKERRFIPLRLDNAPIKGSLAQFSYINWCTKDHQQEYIKLLESCKPIEKKDTLQLDELRDLFKRRIISLGHTSSVTSVAFSSDGRRAISGSDDKTVRLWDIESGRCERVLEGHTDSVWSVAFSSDCRRAISGSDDKTVRLWDIESGRCERVLEGHTDSVMSVAFSSDCRRAISGSSDKTVRLWDIESGRCERVLEGHTSYVTSVAFSSDGRRAISGSFDKTVRLWDIESGKCERELEGHTSSVNSVAFSSDCRRAISGSDDKTVRLWDIESGRCERVLEGHTDSVNSIAFSSDGRRAISGSYDKTVRLWDIESGKCERVLKGHTDSVTSVAFSTDGRRAISGSYDKTVRLWDIESGRCERVLEGHTSYVNSVAFSSDCRRAISGSYDNTVRLWDIESGICERVLEGHTDSVRSVAFSSDCRRAITGSDDNTVRLWDIEIGRCERVLEGHTDSVNSVAFGEDCKSIYSATFNGVMSVWDISNLVTKSQDITVKALGRDINIVINDQIAVSDKVEAQIIPKQEQYTNAKVLLVGDSGVGKSGLSNYLALGINVEDDKPLPSTDGAWATHWPLRHSENKAGVEREIWLWDFAGQVDYRLVHQLFMDDTSVAVLVFNPQNENPFEGLGHWDRDLQKITKKTFKKLLAAGRVDRGGLVVSIAGIKKFMDERGFIAPLHLTSAKTGEGCDALRESIVKAINWENIPITTSPVLYQRMKEETLRLRDSGTVLIRLSELNQRMDLLLSGQTFTPDELKTALGHLSSPGMIKRMEFGGFILLRPEVLSRYAAALVRKVRKHPQEMGCILEDELLAGDLDYQDFKRLTHEDEAVILRALLETLISRAWCLRQPCDGTAMLIFPSYFRRERKEQPSHPSVLVTYRFDGPTDNIYATLVVRLHHTVAFQSTDLWKSAADFETQTGAALGFTLMRETEGASRLEVYFEPEVDLNSRVLFLRYIHDHLTQHAKNVVRLRHYFCGNKKCKRHNLPFTDQALIDEALAPGGERKVFCPCCGKPIPLYDVIEDKFDSPAIKEQVREMQNEVQAVIDNESRDLILVGHAFSIVGEAGQIYRGYTNSDHGIDGEIEFKDDQGRATGKRLYLQLKSGDSYLKKHKGDGVEVFQIKKPRWVDYWQQQAYAVMLVIRTSDGEIRWMRIDNYLRLESENGTKPVKQIIFDGERFDMTSVRILRDKILKGEM